MKPFRISASPRVLLCLLSGLLTFLIVQFGGFFAGVSPSWFVLAVVVVVVLLDQNDSPSWILMLVGAIVGLLPVAGFLSLPAELSTLGLVMGGFVSVKVLQWSRRPVSIGFQGLASALPASVGGVFTFWWWSDLTRGSTVDILTRLMTQWDLSRHFLFFASIVRDGSYLLLASSPSDGYAWEGKEYPAGIHYVWSQFALPLREASSLDRSQLVPLFAQAIVLTGAVAVAVISLAISRLGQTTLSQLWGGTVGAALGAAMFCAGPLSASFWNGFANVPAIVIGLTLLITFLVDYPKGEALRIAIYAVGLISLALNWYPTVAIFVPAVIVVTIRILATKRRSFFVIVVAVTAVLIAPVIWLLRFVEPSEVLEATGGTNKFPETLLIGGSILALGSTLLIPRGRRVEITVMLASPAVPLYVLGSHMITNDGDLRYYFHKFGLFVGTYLLILVVTLIVSHFQRLLGSTILSLGARIRGSAGVLLVSAALLQTFGYWGPELNGLSSETVGPIQRARIMEQQTKASDFRPLSALVIRESTVNRSRSLSEKSCMLLVLPKDVATDAAEGEFGLAFGLGDPANSLWLANIWFHSLSDSATTEAIDRTPRTTELGRVFDDFPPLQASRIDETIEETFSPSEVCILSTPEINSELRKKSDAWRTYDISS